MSAASIYSKLNAIRTFFEAKTFPDQRVGSPTIVISIIKAGGPGQEREPQR